MIRHPREIQSGSDRKSVLAKLLATENITVEIRNVATAFFDIKNRLLVIPQLKSDLIPELYDMFIGHEVGHALYTPQDALIVAQAKKINHQIWNIVEDIRIEKLIKRQYPGLKRDFLIGYRDLLARDFFGIKGKDLNTEINFLDRINLEAKCGSSLGIKYSPEEQQIIDSLQTIENHQDTLDACLRIQAFLKQRKEKKKAENGQPKPKQKTSNNDGDSYGPQEGDSPEPMDDDDLDNKEDGASEGGASEDEANSSIGGASSPGGGGDEGGTGEEIAPSEESITVKKLEKALKELLDTGFFGRIRNLTIPTFHLESVIFPYSKCREVCLSHLFPYSTPAWESLQANYNVYKESTKNIISYLVKEFELKKNAFDMQKTQITKTGILDNKKLFSYQLVEDIFKRNSYTPGGKSHGLVLFMDWSGSMSDDMRHSIKQLFCLTDFCQKVKIPFEVYSFVSQYIPNYNHNNPLYTPKIGNLVSHPFSLWNILSSKMNHQEYIQMQKIILHLVLTDKYPANFRLGGTPLNETIMAAMQIVPQFKKDYRLQKVHTVFITDGDGHSVQNYHINGNSQTTGIDYQSDKLYLYDAMSGTQLYVKRNGNVYNELTQKLFEVLQNRTGSNVIGFYLTRRYGTSSWNKWFTSPSATLINQLNKDFTKKGFVEAKQAGYSSYFILNLETMNLDSYPVFTWNPSHSIRNSKSNNLKMEDLKQEFNKFAKQMTTNKLLLTQFIKQIV